VAAVAGTQVGYAIGRHYGIRLFKPHAKIFKTEYLEQAQDFFDKRGPRSVVLARFIPFVRTIIPILAGTGRMPARKFAFANLIGATIWAVGVSLLGFWLGKSIDIDKYIYPIVAVIIVLSLIPPFLEYRKHRASSGRG
jgi:membrane-associated protein